MEERYIEGRSGARGLSHGLDYHLLGYVKLPPGIERDLMREALARSISTHILSTGDAITKTYEFLILISRVSLTHVPTEDRTPDSEQAFVFPDIGEALGKCTNVFRSHQRKNETDEAYSNRTGIEEENSLMDLADKIGPHLGQPGVEEDLLKVIVEIEKCGLRKAMRR
ncbi:MAG: hypothetical protein M1450_04740 [Patescibacteria group bacterium]|nr:hypothetical protein [Patescibacteria group bacterium]